MKYGEFFFGVFGPADGKVVKTVESEVGALGYPTVSFLSGLFGLDFFAPRPDVCRVVVGDNGFPRLVVARVQAEGSCLAGR